MLLLGGVQPYHDLKYKHSVITNYNTAGTIAKNKAQNYVNCVESSNNLQHCVTAPGIVKSRYSRYMLCVPLRESYRNQIPIFLINFGLFSDTFSIKH